MSSPDDKKIDFEKLSLSDDLTGSLEPIAEEAPEKPAVQQEAVAEVQTDEELKAESSEKLSAEAIEAPPSKFQDFLKRLSTADPYTVMLGMAVAALLIAVLCCLVELYRYGFHVSTKEVRTSLSMIAPIGFFKIH